MTAEKNLWDGLEDKNMEIFKNIYDEFYPVLFRYGRRVASCDEIVCDSIQDLFLSLYERKSTFNKQKPLRFFLLSAFRNKIVDNLKCRTHCSVIGNEDSLVNFSEISIIEAETDAEEEQMRIQKMERIMETLSVRQQKALQLRYYEGLSPQQIAEVMNINYQSTLNLIQRGLQRMSILLKK
jgi:RNA polymerase sigma factor (sigma-70 family)